MDKDAWKDVIGAAIAALMVFAWFWFRWGSMGLGMVGAGLIFIVGILFGRKALHWLRLLP